MAKITLTVIADTQKAEGQIKAFKSNVESAFSKPIQIKINASEADKATKDMIEYAKWSAKAAEAAAKLTNAEARKIDAQTRAAAQAEKAARAAQKAASAYQQEASAANTASQAQKAFLQSTALVIQNAGNLEVRIRSLTSAYNALAQAANGGIGPYTGGNEAEGYFQTTGLTARQPYRHNYIPRLERGYDYDWEPTVEGATAAAQAVDNASASANRASANFSRFGDNARAAWEKLKEGTPIADALGDSIGNIIVKITTWQVVNGIVASIKRAFTDALDTMKAVDDELVTVRKVTGFTADEMKRVEEQAYKTASAYGVAADAYLESVSAFARAGYKDQSADLAELSTKTQIVGDTTAEVANQFLLSVDAAYKYQGSIEELTKVLDGANEIDNKYATSIEKIAEGMGIVAPVAAQMHVSVGELAAAIGTITAVTQRTGSEAARALRALFLNIAGDTKTEIDEGVTWTTGEIEGLRDVIKLYAKDAYEAAQATGAVIDPMEAIGGLAKSMKEGLLTEQELMSMVSDIGGKLRTSQLLAIIQNWDMYQSMIEDFGNAAGSADKEVSNALDSWTRKTNQLSNAFTELISHIISSDGIKAGIDLLTGFVKILDSGVGQVAALSAAFLAFGKVIAGISKSNVFNFLINEIKGLASGAVSAKTALADLWELFSQNPAVIATAIAAIVYGLKELDDALTTTTSEYADAVRKNIEAYEADEKELDSLNDKIEENNRLIEESNELGKDDSYRERLSEENGRLEEQIRLIKDRQLAELAGASDAAVGLANGQYGLFDYNETLSFISHLGPVAPGTLGLEAYFNYLKEYSQSSLPLAKEAGDAFRSLTTNILDSRDALIKIRDARGYLTDSEEEALSVLDAIIGAYVSQLDVVKQVDVETKKSTATVAEEVDVLKQLNDAIDGVQSALKTIQAAQDEYNESGAISVDTLQALLQLEPEYLAALIDENGQINLNSEAVSTLIDGKNVLLERLAAESVATYAAQEAERLLAEQEGDAGTAAQTAAGKLDIAAQSAELLATSAIKGASGVTALDMSLQRLAGEKGLKKNYAKELIDNVTQYANALSGAIGSTNLGFSGWSPSSSSSSSKTGSGSSGSDKDPELEAKKATVALEKQRLAFLEASGASTEEKLAQIKKIQDALHDEAEYMRKSEAYIRGDESALKDVLAVSTEWWTYQDKTTKLLEEDAKLAEEIAKTLREEAADTIAGISNELQKQEDAIISPLQEELDALKESHELRKQETEEAEKLLAVEQARIALENAENERNVRIYNAATGQWEWVANPQTVKSARDNLQSAQKNLADFYSEQSYNARVDALENRISVTQATYKDMNAAVKDAAQAVRDGTMTEAQAYETLLAPSLLGIGSTAGYADTLRSLGIVTAMQNSGVGGYGGGVSGTSIGTQNNGNVYQIGGISLSEAQAKSMSVYEFMQLADTLALHGN